MPIFANNAGYDPYEAEERFRHHNTSESSESIQGLRLTLPDSPVLDSRRILARKGSTWFPSHFKYSDLTGRSGGDGPSVVETAYCFTDYSQSLGRLRLRGEVCPAYCDFVLMRDFSVGPWVRVPINVFYTFCQTIMRTSRLRMLMLVRSIDRLMGWSMTG